jgi:hypothetical protein
MSVSENDFLDLPFELDGIDQLDTIPFDLRGGGETLKRPPELVIVRARRRKSQQGKPSYLRSIISFLPNEPFPGEPWVIERNPCRTVANSTGRKLLHTQSEDGGNVYDVPPNFSFQALTTKANEIKVGAALAGLEQDASILNRHLALFLCWRNAFCKKTVPTFSRVALASGGAAQAPFVLAAFTLLVKTGGLYDWKNAVQGARDQNGRLITFQRNGAAVGTYEPFGNWAFGFFGAQLGIPRDVLLRGADFYQRASSGTPDDPIVQANITLGIDAFQNAYQPIARESVNAANNEILAALVQC